MRNKRLNRLAYTVLSTLWYTLVCANVIFVFLVSLSMARTPEFLVPVVEWVQSNRYLLPYTIGGYVAVNGLLSYVSKPRLWKAAQGCIDALHDHVFENAEGSSHHHRVTLFQWRRFAWWPRDIHGRFRNPWSGWLHPVVRSGHTTQRSETKFLVPRNDPERAQGVAGEVWNTRRVLNYSSLPHLTENSTPDDYVEYADKSKVPTLWLEDRIKNKKPCARSFVGIPVEVDHDVWGVVLLDSRQEKLPHAGPVRKTYRLFGEILGNILPRERRDRA